MAKVPIWNAWKTRNDPPEGAISRGLKDTKVASRHWWRFRIPAALLTIAFAVWSALLPKDATTLERIAIAVGGTVGGAVIVGVVAFAFLVLSAPTRQRNDEREKGALLRERNQQLFEELSHLEEERDDALAAAADAEAQTQVYIEKQHQWHLPEGMTPEQISEVFQRVETRLPAPPPPPEAEQGDDNH